MSKTLLALVEGHVINVGDISTVAPFTEAMHTTGQREGSKITFRSKATSIFIPGHTPEQFMDKLVAATTKLELPD